MRINSQETASEGPPRHFGDVVAVGFKLSEVDAKAWDSSFIWFVTAILAILFLAYFVRIHKAFLSSG